jgi:dTDP-4-dehydrorhamnose 3,5-epimerase
MESLPTELEGVRLLVPRVFADDRGFFMETWNAQVFARIGIDVPFVQDNHSRSEQWTLRGLHYQLEQPQGKLVRVVSGEILDVAVDLRRSSPTLGRWTARRLSAENRHQLWVPPGFAHGFLVLSEHADVVYKCTEFYRPDAERCLHWSDAALAIEWPLPLGVQPRLSARDAAAPAFDHADLYG